MKKQTIRMLKNQQKLKRKRKETMTKQTLHEAMNSVFALHNEDRKLSQKRLETLENMITRNIQTLQGEEEIALQKQLSLHEQTMGSISAIFKGIISEQEIFNTQIKSMIGELEGTTTSAVVDDMIDAQEKENETVIDLPIDEPSNEVEQV